jgi:hypothetical protein
MPDSFQHFFRRVQADVGIDESGQKVLQMLGNRIAGPDGVCQLAQALGMGLVGWRLLRLLERIEQLLQLGCVLSAENAFAQLGSQPFLPLDVLKHRLLAFGQAFLLFQIAGKVAECRLG